MAWDLGDIEITIVQKGTIIFTLTPLTATVVIDGNTVNTSNPVTLDYGLHRMQISADGYDTISQYIKVAEPTANISVELEKSEVESSETPENESSTESSESNSGTTTKKYETTTSSTEESESETNTSTSSSDEVAAASTKYKVYINAPEGVEAYLDGNYIGITPVSFDKKEGSYVVSLRKNGYQTRSYTLQIDSEEKDVNYTFTELLPDE
jgi:activator of HSP90 ATPase